MVQLRIQAGRQAGTETVARRFPFRIGRGKDAHLQLDEPGIWDAHCELLISRSEGVLLQTAPNALTSVNGTAVAGATRLRQGDSIEMGSARLRFWLSAARQRSFRAREWFTWLALAGVTAAQAVLIVWVLP